MNPLSFLCFVLCAFGVLASIVFGVDGLWVVCIYFAVVAVHSFVTGLSVYYDIAKERKGITRCKDCQHCALEFKEQRFGEPSKYVRVCLLHDHETTLDDYCSWGLRKGGADYDR